MITGFIAAILSVVVSGSVRLTQKQTETDRLTALITPLKDLTGTSSPIYYLSHSNNYDLQNELQFLLVPSQLTGVKQLKDVPPGAFLLIADTTKTNMAGTLWQGHTTGDNNIPRWLCLVKKDQQ